MAPSESTIIDAVTDPRDGRGNAKALESRLRWGVTPEERATAKAAIMKAIEVGREMPDGTIRKPGPRTMATLVKTLAALNAQDQDDLHHLEGQRVNLTATVSKPPDEEAADLLAEMRSRDLTPRAN